MVKKSSIQKITKEEGISDYVLAKYNENLTFRVYGTIKQIFEYKRYENLFNFLYQMAQKLNEPLDFYVEIDYVTAEAFYTYTDDDYMILEETIGTRIFELITDLTINHIFYNSNKICKNYLSHSQLTKLFVYYTQYHDIVIECFKRGYSSLYLYELLVNNKEPFAVAKNICMSLKNDAETTERRNLAFTLILEFKNEILKCQSERSKDELYFYMDTINKMYPDFDDDKIKKINQKLFIADIYSQMKMLLNS